MALTQTADTKRTVFGNKKVHYGSFTQVNLDVGGNIATGLVRTVEAFYMTGMTSWSAVAGLVTAVTLDPGGNQTGSWLAIGY